MLHAITIHPLTVIATDMIIKSIPVGSKNKNDRNILHNVVKRGEKRNMTRVFELYLSYIRTIFAPYFLHLEVPLSGESAGLVRSKYVSSMFRAAF